MEFCQSGNVGTLTKVCFLYANIIMPYFLTKIPLKFDWISFVQMPTNMLRVSPVLLISALPFMNYVIFPVA